jgi:hypothetical protein
MSPRIAIPRHGLPQIEFSSLSPAPSPMGSANRELFAIDVFQVYAGQSITATINVLGSLLWRERTFPPSTASATSAEGYIR